MFRRTLTVAIPALVVLTGITLALLHGVDFSHSPEEIAAAYQNSDHQPVSFTVELGDRLIRGVHVGDPANPPIVFVHGSPGTWDNFLTLMTDPDLLAAAFMIACDRPGFGESLSGGAEASLPKQAAAVARVIDNLAPGRPAVLVGHSFGGPVIAQVAVSRPEQVRALVLIAASIDPQLEEKRWFNHVAEWQLINWALPRDLITSNREILPLKSELVRLQRGIGAVAVPVVVVHGQKDRLVPFENVAFIRREFGAATVQEITDPDWGHFIPWTQTAIVQKVLLGLIHPPPGINPGHSPIDAPPSERKMTD